jgi:hypothetical protein
LEAETKYMGWDLQDLLEDKMGTLALGAQASEYKPPKKKKKKKKKKKGKGIPRRPTQSQRIVPPPLRTIHYGARGGFTPHSYSNPNAVTSFIVSHLRHPKFLL